MAVVGIMASCIISNEVKCMDIKHILHEYQKLLLGNSHQVSPRLFCLAPALAEKGSIEIIRYVVEKILEWTPDQMRYHFTPDIIKHFKLERFINCIQLPPETTREDTFVYAHKLYPHIVKLNRRELSILMLNRVMSGKLQKFPKGFFDDENGRERAIYCLNHVLSEYEHFKSTEELYETFTGEKGRKIIRKYRLENALRKIFGSPLEYLHESLSSEDRDETLYHYTAFIHSIPPSITKRSTYPR